MTRTGANAAAQGAGLLGLLLAGSVLAYVVGFALWYGGTPLGMFPPPDGQRMVDLALRIAGGELPSEPLSRAPVYPAVLALMVKVGVAPADVPASARVLNVALHFASSVMAMGLARRLWRSGMAGWLAFVLFACHPVVLHFAVDPLDITLAIALMLGGIAAALRTVSPRTWLTTVGWLSLAASLLTLAALTRPQLFAVLMAFLFWASWRRAVSWQARVVSACAAALPVALLCGGMGLINMQLSGEFRVLPWQSSFHLWAANRTDADGRYFVPTESGAGNEAAEDLQRLEAERGLQAAFPDQPMTADTAARYWRAAVVAEIAAAPLAWLELLARKSFYLLNNFEQSSSKTYSFHRDLSPWLRFNPLCWSVLLCTGLLGWAGLATHNRSAAALMNPILAAYVAVLLLSYVSSDLRLPLIPLMAVLSGGALTCFSGGIRLGRLGVIVLLTGVSVVSLPSKERERTYVQDHVLLARALQHAGDFSRAEQEALGGLARQGDNPAALELVCLIRFEAWQQEADVLEPSAALREACVQAPSGSSAVGRVLGVLDWRAGNAESAISRWQSQLATSGPERDQALAALLMVGARTDGDAIARECRQRRCPAALELALEARGFTGLADSRGGVVSLPRRDAQLAALQRLYAPAASNNKEEAALNAVQSEDESDSQESLKPER